MSEIIDKVGVDTTVQMAELRAKLDTDKRVVDPELRESLIYGYIAEHNGQEITLRELGKAAGYTSTAGLGAAARVRALEQRGKIRTLKISAKKTRYYINSGETKTKPDEIDALSGVDRAKFQQEEFALCWLGDSIWPFLQGYSPEPEISGHGVQVLKNFYEYLETKHKDRLKAD